MVRCSCMPPEVQKGDFAQLLERACANGPFPHVIADAITQTGQGLVDVVACFCAFSEANPKKNIDLQNIRVVTNNYGLQLARVKLTFCSDELGLLSINGIDLSHGHDELFEVPPRCPGPILHGERQRIIPLRISRARKTGDAYVRVIVNREVLDGSAFREYGPLTEMYAQMPFPRP